MRTLLVAALTLTACGFEAPATRIETRAEYVSTRCTVDTKQADWECCEDHGLLCHPFGVLYVCLGHKWELLTPLACRAGEQDGTYPRGVCAPDVCGIQAL